MNTIKWIIPKIRSSYKPVLFVSYVTVTAILRRTDVTRVSEATFTGEWCCAIPRPELPRLRGIAANPVTGLCNEPR